jgi:hypothetical protein
MRSPLRLSSFFQVLPLSRLHVNPRFAAREDCTSQAPDVTADVDSEAGLLPPATVMIREVKKVCR